MEECAVKFDCKYFILCLESKELESFENFQAEIHQKINLFYLYIIFPVQKSHSLYAFRFLRKYENTFQELNNFEKKSAKINYSSTSM